jgi:heterodisulfide reductase subunit A
VKAPAGRRTPAPVLVAGGGPAGQRAALDLVHAGLPVLLVERGDSLGGTTAQLGTMFPLHACLLCRGEAKHGPGCTRPVISADLLDRGRPDGLEVWTRGRLVSVEGGPGDLKAVVRREPRFVDPARCVACDLCAKACPHEMSDPFEAGLARRRAAYRPADRCVPDAYAIEKGPWCEGCRKCADACPTGAIDLDEKARTTKVPVSAVVLATGMRLSDPVASAEYGYGRYANVFTGLEMERMCSPAGPGEGRVARRSDGQAPKRIAWLQCVGSRDEKHDWCSAFCCGYATRQAVLARQLLPGSEAAIFMMDDRVFARGFSGTYDPLRREHGIRLARCRLSVLREDPATRDLVLQVSAEDGKVTEERFGMVVLSVGAEAAADAADLARSLGLASGAGGFLRATSLDPVGTGRPGIFVAGTAAGPADIADSVAQAGAAAAGVCAFLDWQPPALVGEPPAAAAVKPRAGHSARTRIGVFACECAGCISDVVDLPETVRYASRLPGVATARSVTFGCLDEGLQVMRAAVREHHLDAAVVGACSRRTFTPLFERALGIPVRVASLREECAAVHADDPVGATRKARELLRIAAVRVAPPPAHAGAPLLTIVPRREALVVGAGMAGLTACLRLADAGVAVHLVERADRPGGHALLLDRTPDGADVRLAVGKAAARAARHPNVTLYDGSEVVRLASHLGEFTAIVRTVARDGRPGRESTLKVGAAVVATGAAEYRGPTYGLGSSPRVVTLLDLGRKLRDEPDLSSHLGQVAFVGCVGPWDEPGTTASWRCSRGCCHTMVRRARALKEANPACLVAVLVREVNTYAFAEEDYTAARKAGVLFARFDPRTRPVVDHRPDGSLRVAVADTSLGETLDLAPDLLVLAAAVLPRPEAARTATRLGVRLGADGFVREWEAKTRATATLEPGVFACGLAAGPKPLAEVVAQSLAAAQAALVHLSRTRTVDTRAVARIDTKLCADCLTCVRTCPYGVPRAGDGEFPPGVPRGKAWIDPARCQGCGTCTAECPARAIQLDEWGDGFTLRGGLLGRWVATGETAS